MTKYKESLPRIAIRDCRKGYLYKLESRNLASGVYDGEEGFIGIRTKFSSVYLFTEYHWDQGPPYGTAIPLKEVGKVPEGIPLITHFPCVDKETDREVEFGTPISQGGKGWFFKDTGEGGESICSYSPGNAELQAWIEKQDQELGYSE